MSNFLTEDQIELQRLARDFMRNEVKPYIKEYDQSGEFPLELYKKGFELGLHLLGIPEAYGGMGLDHLTECIMLEELGKVEPAFAITYLCTALALECVLVGGNDEQKQKASDILVPGAFGAFCLTEPDSGSDAASLKTTAVRDGSDYIINGHKCFATNAEFADLFVVFATVDKGLGARGITAFMVEKGTPGLVIGKHEDKMGLRLSNTADVFFDNVRVSQTSRLSEEGKGFNIAMAGLDAGRIFNAAISTGLSQSAIEAAIEYSQQRIQFGKRLADMQAIQLMMADMDKDTEAGRQLYMHAARMLDAGLKANREASIAKCFCGDTAVRVSADAVQVFGGYGFSREYPVEKMMRDSKIFQIFEGTNQIQRIVIARNLLK
ncbi:acyl-CoA dehydrogenase family protein [Eubacterium barkeri]|uniref:Butyryl-CoA dehydrogenase n=1 Tax=Eubacterium barkeri TaxID=1528 RepID=A0A1H3I4L4_EUBBA|nr:acyl-CoA dehydrogenase family protein [Eubacterium barkeri]SDY22552.1 butyryl-CoA dehydrogenase [Eubacterium barkeri]